MDTSGQQEYEKLMREQQDFEQQQQLQRDEPEESKREPERA